MMRLSTRWGPGPALAAAVVAGSLASGASGAGAMPVDPIQALGPAWKLCARAVDEAERRYRIPGQLMAAMALAESGRYHEGRRATFAWPWTVTSGKDNWFLPRRAAAVAKVRALRARGVTNIDVGCMQVNLAWHADAFADLDSAFDPETNVAYAAKHLVGLFAARRSWTLAVGLYHSATTPLRRRYQKKVFGLWRTTRRRAAEARRHRVIAAFEARRRARLAAQADRRARWMAASRESAQSE